MGSFKQWRCDNPTWNTALRKFNFSKRVIRTVATHPVLYWRYYQQCRQSYIAQQITTYQDCVQPSSRPFNKYLNKYWTSRQKMLAALGTLTVLEQKIAPVAAHQLFGRNATGISLATLTLKTGGQAEVKLMHSRFVREGEMGLYLFAPDSAEPLYSLTFSFDQQGKCLYLCGLQGPKPGEGQDQVREMTKALHGIRPKNLLLSAAYALADGFSMESICGISDQHHIKSHYLKSSYDSFWQEVSHDDSKQGWFSLIRQETVKDIEQVESKHRSAFRKREALRQQMRLDIMQALVAISPPINAPARATDWVVSSA